MFFFFDKYLMEKLNFLRGINIVYATTALPDVLDSREKFGTQDESMIISFSQNRVYIICTTHNLPITDQLLPCQLQYQLFSLFFYNDVVWTTCLHTHQLNPSYVLQYSQITFVA